MVEVIPGVLRAPRGASVSSGDQQGDESERLAATHTSASSQGHHGAGSTRVRLLALYTARALHSAAGRGSAVRLERAIQDAVDSTNQALQRSLTEGPCQFALVAIAQACYEEQSDQRLDLAFVKANPKIASLRQATGADSILLVSEGGGRGYAYVFSPQHASTDLSAFDQLRYAAASIATVRASQLWRGTVAHELGHVLGAVHEQGVLHSGPLSAHDTCEYSNFTFRTIMHPICSSDEEEARQCPRMMAYSNAKLFLKSVERPDVLEDPITTLTSTSCSIPLGSQEQHDNSRVISNNCPFVASTRERASSTADPNAQQGRSRPEPLVVANVTGMNVLDAGNVVDGCYSSASFLDVSSLQGRPFSPGEVSASLVLSLASPTRLEFIVLCWAMGRRRWKHYRILVHGGKMGVPVVLAAWEDSSSSNICEVLRLDNAISHSVEVAKVTIELFSGQQQMIPSSERGAPANATQKFLYEVELFPFVSRSNNTIDMQRQTLEDPYLHGQVIKTQEYVHAATGWLMSALRGVCATIALVVSCEEHLDCGLEGPMGLSLTCIPMLSSHSSHRHKDFPIERRQKNGADLFECLPHERKSNVSATTWLTTSNSYYYDYDSPHDALYMYCVRDQNYANVWIIDDDVNEGNGVLLFIASEEVPVGIQSWHRKSADKKSPTVLVDLLCSFPASPANLAEGPSSKQWHGWPNPTTRYVDKVLDADGVSSTYNTEALAHKTVRVALRGQILFAMLLVLILVSCHGRRCGR